MLKVLEGFHNKELRRIVGMTAQNMTGGECEWPPVAEALETAGIWPIKEYIQLSQDTVTQVSCHPIYELCTEAKWMTGTSKFMR